MRASAERCAQQRESALEAAPVRRRKQTGRREARLDEHGFEMRKARESVLAMIGTRSRGAHTAERQTKMREEPQQDEDRHTAHKRNTQHALAVRAAIAEPVQRERMRPRVD